VPPELERSLIEEAKRQGTTPELLALEGVRRILPIEVAPMQEGALLDFLTGFVATADGTSEPYSQDGGRRFAEGLARKHQSSQ
jgi:hypothetical protein